LGRRHERQHNGQAHVSAATYLVVVRTSDKTTTIDHRKRSQVRVRLEIIPCVTFTSFLDHERVRREARHAGNGRAKPWRPGPSVARPNQVWGCLDDPGRWSDGKLGIAFDGNGTGDLIVCATVRTDGDGMPDPPAVVRYPAITAQVARSPTRVTSPEAPGTTAQLPARRSGV
jgi:hypothetical protein